MHRTKVISRLLPILLLLVACLPAAAQLSPSQPDPLARIREAAQGNTQACSATGESLCEQVAPKIIANAQGDSPLAENLRQLTQAIAERKTSVQAQTVSWATAAFQAAGVDVHTEKDVVPSTGRTQEIVVGEIRGREKPDEWVLLGAHLDSESPDNSCNAAMVIEAARDISRTAVRPRRSIRFVLFTGEEGGTAGSWAYVHAHRVELDPARAAILLGTGCGRVTGFTLSGRHDIEPGVREAMKPIEAMGANHYAFGAQLGTDSFDFVLEGIPTLVATREQATPPSDSHAASTGAGNPGLAELKRTTAILGVTAFGASERAEPAGARESRAEIEDLLKSSGLEELMKTAGIWQAWNSGERGRLP
jgi:acetylornithine deacetylase/succinyl-diaminopimelate desuccinylase-like protein